MFLNILSMKLFTEHIIIYSDDLTNRKLAFAYKYTYTSYMELSGILHFIGKFCSLIFSFSCHGNSVPSQVEDKLDVNLLVPPEMKQVLI